jgi:flagellar motor switch protein FliN/FliY
VTTEAAAPAPQSQIAEFLQIWSSSFSQVLGQITGTAVSCTLQAEAPAGLPPAGEGDLWVSVTSSGQLRGEMNLRIAAATVLRLAQIFMSEPATPDAQPTADHRDAVIELMRQVSGIVTTTAKARWGEIQLLVEAAPAAPSWPSAGTFWLQAGEEGPAAIWLEAGISAALAAALRAEKAEPAKAEAARAETANAAPNPVTNSATPASLNDAQQGTRTLDLLMDVQLAMTMRFGTRRMLLREVLELGPGVVIELDRRVQEPVDLLLDGRLVARGEVVVIEGNYGLRVTEVSSLDAARMT